MEIEEVREWLSENKGQPEVSKLFGELAPLNAERVSEYLDSDEGFAALRSRFDRYANKAIQTHDEKRESEIEKRIEDAVNDATKKSKMSATEQVQAEVEALKQQIADRDAAIQRRDLVGKIREEATKRNVPADLVIDFDNPNLTEEKAVERMEAYAKMHADEIQTQVTQRLGASYKPGSGADKKESVPTEDLPEEFTEALKRFDNVDL